MEVFYVSNRSECDLSALAKASPARNRGAKAEGAGDAILKQEIGTMPRKLDREFFNRPTLRVARELLGKHIVRSDQGRRLTAVIAEVEAYKGPRDRACHAHNWRRTARVEPIYGDGGTVYVYLVYGIHWLLNFSTAGEGKPEAVLIRGLFIDSAGAPELLSGPGRITQYLHIDKRLDRADATASTRIWLEDRGIRIPADRVGKGPRVGVDFAGPYWAARAWRFWIDGDLKRRR